MIQQIHSEFRRRTWDESYWRIKTCIEKLDEEQIWHQPNKSTNSIGHLITHLNGNIRQYMLSTLGGQPDNRQRQLEFDPDLKADIHLLMQQLEKTLMESNHVIGNMTEDELTKVFQVQVFEKTGFSIIIHVIEHMSYHTGQIALLTKLLINEDLGFYAGLDL